jgi:hypothetical protein
MDGRQVGRAARAIFRTRRQKSGLSMVTTTSGARRDGRPGGLAIRRLSAK